MWVIINFTAVHEKVLTLGYSYSEKFYLNIAGKKLISQSQLVNW